MIKVNEKADSLIFNNNTMEFRKSCFGSFHSIYGVGKVRAHKLVSFYKYQPNMHEFKEDFRDLINRSIGRNIFNLFLDRKIRLFVANNLYAKFKIFTYKLQECFKN